MVRQPQRNGFILLMVLAVLFIAATLLAMGARKSCAKAIAAGEATQQLQVRWGSHTCARLALQNAELILTPREGDSEPTTAAVSQVVLNNIRFDIVLSDEQAKPSINTLASDAQNLSATLGPLLAGVRQVPPIEPRPSIPGGGGAAIKPYEAFEQVFRIASPAQLLDMEQPSSGVASRITLWGDGRLNYHSASAEAMRLLTRGILNDEQVEMLLRYRTEHPKASMDDATASLKLEVALRDRLRKVLVDRSNCYSAWIIAAGPTRRWYQLSISSASPQGGNMKTVFW